MALTFEVSSDFCAPLYCVWVEVDLKIFISLQIKKNQKPLGAHCQILERGQRSGGWGPALPRIQAAAGASCAVFKWDNLFAMSSPVCGRQREKVV